MTVAVYLWHGHPMAREYRRCLCLNCWDMEKDSDRLDFFFFFNEPDIYIVAITSSYPILAKNTSLDLIKL